MRTRLSPSISAACDMMTLLVQQPPFPETTHSPWIAVAFRPVVPIHLTIIMGCKKLRKMGARYTILVRVSYWIWISSYQGETSPIRKKEENREIHFKLVPAPVAVKVTTSLCSSNATGSAMAIKKVAISISQKIKHLYNLLELRPHIRGKERQH